MFLSPTHHSTVLPDLPQAELYLPADPSHSIVGVARNCVVLGETQSVVRDGLRAVAQAATGEGKVTPIPPPFFRQQADLPDMMLTVRNTDLFRKFENKPFLVQLFSDCPKSAFCSDSAFAAVVTASQSLLDHCERIDLLGTMADGGKRFLGRLECAAKQNRKQARDALLGATGAFDASYLESKNCLSTDATCIFYAIDHPVRLLFWQALR